MKNYYKILGINHNASLVEIKRAYRGLALKWHPDINKSENAQEMFIEINEAYEILSVDSKRKIYNEFFDNYFKNKNSTITSPKPKSDFNQYQEWSNEARQTAYSRAKMSYNEFSESFGKVYEKTTNGCANLFAIALWIGWGPIAMIYCLGFVFDIFKIQPEYSSNVHIRSVILLIICTIITIVGIVVLYRIIKDRLGNE